eukprot:2337112-Prymnesium_polylepis.1
MSRDAGAAPQAGEPASGVVHTEAAVSRVFLFAGDNTRVAKPGGFGVVSGWFRAKPTRNGRTGRILCLRWYARC